MTVKHTLKNGTEIEITGYFYIDTLMARTNISGKWYDGELKSPDQQYESERQGVAKAAAPGYWMFGQVIIPPEKGEEIKQAAENERDANKMMEKMTLQSAIHDGTAFRTAEITEQYGAELHWARRCTEPERAEYAEWFRDLCMIGFSGSARISVSKDAIRKVVGNRHSDGQFNGCSNRAWTITKDEWLEIIEISHGIEARKVEAKKEFEAAEAADIQHKIDTGYCFYCETWCNGDCGHYSKNPMIKFTRDLKQAQREADYGINDNA